MKLTAKSDGKRADVFISGAVEELSRNECVKLIENGCIKVNGIAVTKKAAIKAGDEIEINLAPPEPLNITAEDIPLDIVYEDGDIAVINKPQGMVVHPAHGNYDGTLVNAVMYHIKDLSGINGVMRPGIVHRLDKNTSGLIVIAKNDKAHASLAEQFKKRDCKKVYLALCEGHFTSRSFKLENYIARAKNDRKKMAVYNSEDEGKFASTEFYVISEYGDYSLVACKLNTGRTHQIRVHLASIGHPCIGDAEYGFKRQNHKLNGQALHSYMLSIFHPKTGERMTFFAPLPEYFKGLTPDFDENAFINPFNENREVR